MGGPRDRRRELSTPGGLRRGRELTSPGGLKRGRALAHVLDDLIPVPGTRWRFGLDPLFGLVPGLGDWLGWAAALDLLVTAARLRAPTPVLLRMAGNTALDAVVGVVPLLGDLFDAGWKANRRNLKLLERYVADPTGATRASRLVVVAVLGGTFLIVATAAVGAVMLFAWLLGAVGLGG